MLECSFFSLNFTCGKKRFQVKFFYLTQLAYWLHALPELYFQKVRKVSDDNRSNACTRSAREEAQSFSVLCFPGGAFPSAAVHLSVSAARRRTLFIKVSVQDIKHLQKQEIPEGTLAFVDKIYPQKWNILEALTNLLSCFCYSMSRLGLVLLFLQYVSELGFHIARLFYFTDENHQKM